MLSVDKDNAHVDSKCKKLEKIIYPADTGREAHVCISSEPHQTREVCFWIPKCRAQEARVSEVSPPRRNIQQR